MARVLFALLKASCAAVVLLPVCVLLNKAGFRDGKKTALYFLFACYLSAVYALVGLPNVTYVRLDLNLNLIPVVGMLDDLKNSILNVLLFVPLGFLLLALWGDFRAGKKTILFGLGMSLTIELLQIFTYRATDVNDVITNTLGTALGYLLARLLPLPEGEESTEGLWLTLGITAAVMFFVHPFLSELVLNLSC